MKSIVLIFIKIYWLSVPENRRRKCLFKKSCSHYVYEQTETKGLKAGLRALHFRVRNCNKHYQIIEVNGEKILITKTNKVYPEKELSEYILKK